ncbi:S8 family peptidase [Saccharothrix coeruleofusca]|uniref:Peptidase S8/S53 domain-containing protein n=1 Tax=Saccharothrix coeruleofusca TaxID=33919 RepID=A0A918EEI8_9PSEU|nr:S8 family serine peptidase [Saccharothrix coeruleofusca]GGP66230.1 hypothetical protein GCM10010185_43560 [Saccharothrix coeruleofusca]
MGTGPWGWARTGITALVISAGVATGGAPVVRAQAADGVAPPSGEAHRTVTLITGDRVVVAGDRIVSHTPGPGREDVPVTTYSENGRQYVVPDDAEPLIAGGKLDRRLFDVTSLVEFGYDDAERSTVPVIVRPAAGARADLSTMSVAESVPALNVVTGTVAKSGQSWAALRDGAVEKVWLDGKRKLTLERSAKQIGAPVAWQAGLTGRGVKVAVLDGGIDGAHPDLAGKVIAERNFTGVPVEPAERSHGTHIASTIAGTDERYRGIAPDAQLLDGQICVPGIGGCSDSAALMAMQWAVDQGAQIVNMSFGNTDTPEIDLLEEAVDRFSREKGVLFVAAAGNGGPSPGTISTPSSAESALSVGAVDRADDVAGFSGRGPTATGAVKPDVTAPGMEIVAARAGTEGHVAMSGTSMATPHVAGVAALLKQRHPDWSGERIKAAIMGSATAGAGFAPFEQGAGRVDVPKAMARTVIAEPGNVDLGVRQWPHEDDERVSREVTYRNSGAEPVALDLAVHVTGPGGEAPAGMFTVSPARLTVPAGGEARATITADTAVPAPDGTYAGALIASGGADLRTLLSVNREVEHHDLALTHLDFDGAPSDFFRTTVVNVATGRKHLVDREPEAGKPLRLPKGEYRVYSTITGQDRRYAILAQPKLELDGEAHVVLDARAAKPVRMSTPDPAARQRGGYVLFTATTAGKPETVTMSTMGRTVLTAQIGPDSPDFSTSFGAQFAGTPRDGKTPVTYRLHWTETGGLPTGYERTAEASELAEVTSDIRSAGPGKQYLVNAAPRPAIGTDTAVPEGGQAVDLVTASEDVDWSWGFEQRSADGNTEVMLRLPARSVGIGQSYRQELNTAVFGPSVGDGALTRHGATIGVAVPLFTDSNGGQGDSPSAKGRVTLFREGVRFGETTTRQYEDFWVPTAEAAYRVEVEQSRSVSDVSTRVLGVWTFRSAHTDGPKALPMSVPRFLPELDDDNATRDRVLEIPVEVEQQPGTPEVRRVDVEVSFDDGATWRRTPVVDGEAVVAHDDGAEFASLRATVTDAAGDTGQVSVIRAYKIVL